MKSLIRIATNVFAPLFLLQALALAACGSGGGEANGGMGGSGGAGGVGGENPAVLQVLNTVPTDQESSVDPVVLVRAEFDEPISAASLSARSFSVSEVGGGPVSGAVTLLDAQAAIYEPDVPLALLSGYAATVTTEVRAVSGNTLENDVTWSFTTRDGVWSNAEQIESEDGGSTTRPVVAVSANGEALVAWIELTDLSTNAWANHYSPGSGWGEATLIEAFDGGSADEVDLAIDAMGRGIAVWTQTQGGGSDIFAARYAAGVWEDPRTIHLETLQPVGSPKVDMSPSGEAMAVWTQREPGAGNNVRASRYTPGVGWSEDLAIHTILESQTTFDPEIAVASNGDAIAVWSLAAGGDASVYANRYSSATGWGNRGERISGTGPSVDSRRAKVAMDSSGNAIAVWEAEPFSDPPSIWASRFVVGTGWEEPLPIAEEALDSAQVPRIAVDGEGNAFAIWSQRKSQTRSIVVNRYVESSGWDTPEALFTLDPGMSGFLNDPNIAVDAKGNAVAVWTRNDEPQAQAYASRYVLGVGWSEPEILAEISTGASRDPTVGIDSSGRALTARSQFDGARFNIWANHFE